MNLEITSRCDGSCSHCMSRCTSEGKDMDQRTFDKALQFIRKSKSRVVNVGGGEPSLHPEVSYYGRVIKDRCPGTLTALVSNGNFLNNEDLIEKIIRNYSTVQITYDERYYPNYKDISQVNALYPNIATETHIRSVLHYGRAIDNKLECDPERKSPFCFNMRSLVKLSGMGFVQANQMQESRHKFCSWSILPGGSITLSESMTCPPIGTVWDTFESLEMSIRNFKCKSCIYAQRLIESGPPYSLIFQ